MQNFHFGGGGALLVIAAVGAVVAGAGFVATVGAPWDGARAFTTGTIFVRFRRLRDFPPSKIMRPYSATRARLVFTPLRCSNSAIMAYDAFLPRSSTMESWSGARLRKGTRLG